jgi:hypothetical protein
MQRLPDSVGDMLWTMALHGLGPKEYLHDGVRAEGEGLHIFGQKHEHRDRPHRSPYRVIDVSTG